VAPGGAVFAIRRLRAILDGIGAGHYVGTATWRGGVALRIGGEKADQIPMDGGRGLVSVARQGLGCGTGLCRMVRSGRTWDFRRCSSPTGSMPTSSDLACTRWHVMDPIRFQDDLKVTIGRRYGGPCVSENPTICHRCRTTLLPLDSRYTSQNPCTISDAA